MFYDENHFNKKLLIYLPIYNIIWLNLIGFVFGLESSFSSFLMIIFPILYVANLNYEVQGEDLSKLLDSKFSDGILVIINSAFLATATIIPMFIIFAIFEYILGIDLRFYLH